MMAKRNTFMSGSAPYFPQAPDIEAAKHLRAMAAAYVRRRANAGDVEVAIAEFRAALAVKGETPSPAAPETPTPPTPSLAEAARALAEIASELWLEGPGDRVVTFERYQDATRDVARALAAEEARDRLRRQAAGKR